MNSKSTKVKDFIKATGTKDQLFVFAGSNTTNSSSNSTQTFTDLWTQSDFSVRVGQSSLIAVVPYVKWIQKKPYKPWSANTTNNENFYAYNDQNGYVYLCISDNISNRIDLSGQNVSNNRPTHIAGIQTYSDGYSWKPLYKITSSMERFISSTWLPIVSFDNFDADPQISQLEQTRDFCESNTGQTGFCGLYAKLPLSTDDDAGTIEYEQGDLFTIASPITCSDCFYITQNSDKFKSVFYKTQESVLNSISIVDNYTLVGNLISSGQLGLSSPYYYLYNINENDELSEGSIVSAFLDLSSFSTNQLICTNPNPILSITSASGSGGELRLKTTIVNGAYLVSGIEVTSRGSGYKDIRVSVDSSILPNVDTSIFASTIKINLDTIDGLGFDPVDILNSQHVMIDARMEKKALEDAGIVLPTEINFFGLIKNPLEISNQVPIIAGSNKNKKIDVIYRTSIKVGVTSSSPGEFPSSVDEITIPVENPSQTTNVASNILNPTIKFGGVKQITPTTAQIELKGLLYAEANSLLGKTFSVNTAVNIIGTIEQEPIFIQFSGNPLITNKQSTKLNISDVDSVIIRINMVQGM